MSAGSSLAKLALRHPVEAAYRLAGKLEDRRVETESRAAIGVYEPTPGWLEVLHAHLNVQPCRQEPEFCEAWGQIESGAGELRVESHDGDRAFARALWCMARHCDARRVVETGVARGVSSGILLQAIDDREDAHLWSVDLPLLSEEWAELLGTAIPQGLRDQWTYLRGPSKRVLPRLLRRIRPIDLFVQDSRGTLATAGFEFRVAWEALRPGGVLIANSVDRSVAFDLHVREVSPAFAFTASFSRKPGVFGFAQKA
jgi:predicted O-methyltransferase YrrM